MDIDFDKSDPDYDRKMREVPEMILAKREELGLLMLERSATKGYHVVFERREEIDQEKNLQWASDLLGVQFDKGAKDLTRVFFASSAAPDDLLFLSDELFINEVAYGWEEGSATASQNPGQSNRARGVSFSATSSRNPGPMPPPTDEEKAALPDNYNGILYSDIIAMWWKFYNNGQEPVKQDRDSKTFELACALRHICDYNRAQLDKVIPCYDGFPEVEKLKCIDSALSYRRGQIPVKLRNVLGALRTEKSVTQPEVVEVVDEIYQRDWLFYYTALPKCAMPMGIKESIEGSGRELTLPIIFSVCTVIGFLATGVTLEVHDTARGLNLISFVVGESATGKDKISQLMKYWKSGTMEQDKIYKTKEKKYRKEKQQVAQTKQQPEEPEYPVRNIPLDTTPAQFMKRADRLNGLHGHSWLSEAELIVDKWGREVKYFSVLVRNCYDEESVEREAASVDAAHADIERFRWNVALSGTPDSLYRLFSNVTNGTLSRVAICDMPDNTFEPLGKKQARMTDTQIEAIGMVANLLTLMKGNIALQKLEDTGRQWLEKIRLEAIMNDDKVLARTRFRSCVTAQRMMCCIMLCAVCGKLVRTYGYGEACKMLTQDPTLWIDLIKEFQTPRMLSAFDVIANALVDNTLYYFRSRIEAAYQGDNYKAAVTTRVRVNKNDSIFARLAPKFTLDDCLNVSCSQKPGSTRNSVRVMLNRWKTQGLIEAGNDGSYHKIAQV